MEAYSAIGQPVNRSYRKILTVSENRLTNPSPGQRIKSALKELHISNLGVENIQGFLHGTLVEVLRLVTILSFDCFGQTRHIRLHQ